MSEIKNILNETNNSLDIARKALNLEAAIENIQWGTQKGKQKGLKIDK